MRSFTHIAATTLVRQTARLIPAAILRRVYRRATAGLGVAVCLHRVLERPLANDPVPDMTVRPETVDAFLDLVSDAHRAPTSPLVMSFDDGYSDAAEFIATRAPRHAHVSWLMFVCPEKTEKQVGYRWDLWAQLGHRNPRAFSAYMRASLDRNSENERLSLRASGARPQYRLATPERCRELDRLDNVRLGNHTDVHFQLTLLREEEAARELAASGEHFAKLFGHRAEHFAFPFGSAGQVGGEHVACLRQLGAPVMWTTHNRPFDPKDVRPGGVVPRFVLDGTWSARATALWIAVQAVRHRLRPATVEAELGPIEVSEKALEAAYAEQARARTEQVRTRPTARLKSAGASPPSAA